MSSRSISLGAILLGLVCLMNTAAPADLSPAVPSDLSPPAVRLHLERLEYAEARSLAERLLNAVEPRDPHGLDTAGAIELLLEAWLESSVPRRPEMLDLARRAVEIRAKLQGSDHLDSARSLGILADVYRDGGDASSAAAVREPALAVQERRLGREALDVTTTRSKLAGDWLRSGRRQDAIDLLEEVLETREAAAGTDSPMVADILESLAKARPASASASLAGILRAREIREKAQGPDHPDLATTLDIQAVLLYTNGHFREARPLLQRAIEIWEDSFGPNDIRVAVGAINLGIFFHLSGDLARARDLYERALEIRETVWGPDHVKVNGILNNLAVVHTETGNFDRAETLLLRVLAAYRNRLGEDHLRIANALSNLAGVYEETGDLEQARQKHEQGLAMDQRIDAEPSFIAKSHENLGRVLTTLQRYDLAREHLETALEMQISVWGAQSLEVAMCQRDYGTLLRVVGQAAEAVEVLARSVQNLRGTSGPGWRLYDAMIELGIAQRDNGQPAEAMTTLLEAEAMSREIFRRNCRFFSEREALNYSKARRSGLDLALPMLTEDGAGLSDTVVVEVFDHLVRSRALVLDEMAARHRDFLGGTPPEIEELVQRLENAWGTLAELTTRRYSASAPAELDEELERTRRVAEEAERRLAERSMPFRERMARLSVGQAEIAAALPDDVALVAYAGRGESYLAFVLGAGQNRPVTVSLGDAETVHQRVERWRRELKETPAWPAAAAEREKRYREISRELRRTVWDPVAPLVGEPDLVLVVPDGALHHVTLGALSSDAEGRYLVETGPLFHYVSAERDIVRAVASPPSGRGLLAVGGPRFEGLEVAQANAGEGASTEHSSRASCRALRDRTFGPLPGARAEAEGIAALWERSGLEEVELLVGTEATETAFKEQAPGRRVLHVATHGFFASADCDSLLERVSTAQQQGRRISTLRDNPLLLTGLALAGANGRQNGRAPSSSDDGMLTAQEIATLDLSRAEWVLLSGCGTGLGPAHVEEGILGLRRAFQIAGARTLIMSLWQVDDLATREWMQDLHEARLDGRSTANAVRDATVEMLERRRREGRGTHPASWGAFVAFGDWR